MERHISEESCSSKSYCDGKEDSEELECDCLNDTKRDL